MSRTRAQRSAKTQPGRSAPELGEEAGDRVERALALADAAARKAAQEPDGIRMARVVEHLVRLAFLHQAPRVEDADAVAHSPHHREVVADEEDARPQLLAQSRDEVQHLCLHGRIEAGRGLVEDKESRVGGERHGDERALLHPARELMRVAPHHARRVGDLHPGEHLAGLLPGSGRGGSGGLERLRHLFADPDRRVQGGAGILIDHRDRPGAVPTDLSLGHGQEVGAPDVDRAARHPSVPRQVAHDGERGRGLPAAGLADEAVGASRRDRQRDAAQHLTPLPAHAEGHAEVVELERRRGGDCGNGRHRSNAWVRPSAIRLTPTTRVAMASAGKSVGHQSPALRSP